MNDPSSGEGSRAEADTAVGGRLRSGQAGDGDPFGKRALFSPPPPDDTRRATGRRKPEGVHALYSSDSGSARGPIRVDCSTCGETSYISMVEATIRLASFPVWNPFSKFDIRLPCPACQDYAWCRVRFAR